MKLKIINLEGGKTVKNNNCYLSPQESQLIDLLTDDKLLIFSTMVSQKEYQKTASSQNLALTDHSSHHISTSRIIAEDILVRYQLREIQGSE